MSHPLSLVRDATKASLPIILSNGHFTLGNRTFPEGTKTAFKRTLKSSVHYYSLAEVIFFYKNADASFPEYRKKAVELKITPVVETDRKDLQAYLNGSIDTCPQIDPQMVNSYLLEQESVVASTLVDSNGVDVDDAGASQMSEGQMQEQRAKHAALLERRTQGASVQAMDQSEPDKDEYLRQLRKMHKRKSYGGEGDDDDEEGVGSFDKAFLEADRKVLAKIRADEAPSNNRTTVLLARNMEPSVFHFAVKLYNDLVLKPKDAKYQKEGGHKGKDKDRGMDRDRDRDRDKDKDRGRDKVRDKDRDRDKDKDRDRHKDKDKDRSHKDTDRSSKERPEKPSSSSGGTSQTAAVLASFGTSHPTASEEAEGRVPRVGTGAKAHRTPIIIVPKAMTSTFTTANIKEFLLNGEYLSVEEAKKMKICGKQEKEKAVFLNRQVQDGKVKVMEMYKVIDDPTKLDKGDWDRVVAVFVTGKLWQFKGWPGHYSSPVDLFQKVMGIYATMDINNVDPAISKWNCKVLKLGNDSKKHINASSAKDFWMSLDEFIRLHKPALVTKRS